MKSKDSDDLQKSHEDDEVPVIERLKQEILSFVECLSLRMIFVFCLGAAFSFWAADTVYQTAPSLVTNSYEDIAKSVAAQMKSTPSRSSVLQIMHRYNLGWLYVTRGNNSLVPSTVPYAPDLKSFSDKKSHFVQWKGGRYFEAVEPLEKDELLHISFSANSLLPNFYEYNSALAVPYFGLPSNLGVSLIVLFGTLLLLLITLRHTVSEPLKQLALACSSLFLSRDAYSGIIKGGLKVSTLSVSEVKKMALGLVDARRQYDEQFFARAKKEAELEEQRSTHAKVEQELSDQFHEKIADAQLSLNELHTRESDDEFIASLGHALDMLSSKRQVCQRILDRLNDKYPTSIVHAALLMIEDKTLAVEASIGLDDRALQTLKRVDHNSIASELFRLASYMEFGLNSLRERGLQELALQLSVKSAVYLPLSFQRKNLGILVVYFPIQGQSVNDRIRLLRKVVELASRRLYQMSLYLEELEASRTDPLTNLRNRKYFYELSPQVLERAEVDPENSQFSIMMIDVDHFKKINDSFGHPVGDEVLRMMANTIKHSVRTEADGRKPSDSLIRYGGEEFLVILEKTNAQIAERVAERIRSTVEKKSDWPGGIARCTVSLGIATYPADGIDMENLVVKADTALYYVKNELGRNNFCHSAKVPKTFKSVKNTAKIVGELGVFEPSNLLQALAGANRSGVLAVRSSRQQNCWILFEKGAILKARAGNHKGNKALIEFLTTFQEDGNFEFQEKSANTDPVADTNLDDSYNVSGSLARILLDAALAKDHLDAALSIISSDDVVLNLPASNEFLDRVEILKRLPEPPTNEELTLMHNIAEKIDGSSSLKQVFANFEAIPSALLWHAAALLVQHGLARYEQGHHEQARHEKADYEPAQNEPARHK